MKKAPLLSYQDTYKSQQREALTSLKVKANDEPVSAVEAWALASSLTHEDATVAVWWRKLVGRPAEAVRRVSRDLRGSPPEARQHIITEFAKKHPAIPREKRAS